MKDLAAAYRVHKYAKGGRAACAHGGIAMCNEGCYAKGGMVNPKLEQSKMAEGGEVEEPMDEMDHVDETGDLDNEMEEMSNDMPIKDDEKVAGGRILSKLLGKISNFHKASAR